MENRTVANDEYFAATDDPQKLASGMKDKITSYRNWASSRGLMDLWARKIGNYYGTAEGGNSSHAITRGGQEGELSLMKVNDLRALIQQQLILITGQRPAGRARAINSDTKSLKSARIGTAVSEYYMDFYSFEKKFITAAEIALLCDEAHLDMFWNRMGGDPIAVDPDTGEAEMSGDGELRVHTPWNTARDMGLPVDKQKWKIFSIRENKFDLAAMFPRFEDQIIHCLDDGLPEFDLNVYPIETDAITYHLLVHDRTPVLPKGRYAILIGDEIVLDMPLPFKDYPVGRMAAADVIEGAIGYCAANDLMGLEMLTDALHSIIASNEITFGGQNLVGPDNENIKITDIAKGLRYFEVPPDLVDKLKALELCKTPAEVFNYITKIDGKKDSMVGTNSVVRGQPEGQLAGASGSALALIQAQAISYNSGTQKSYFGVMSEMMTKFIGMLALYADTERVAQISGKVKSRGLKEFRYTGKELSGVSSVTYEIVNPMSQTLGGRLTMAQDLLKAGQCKSPKQYINVVETGQVDDLIQDDEADGMLILEENEWLREGKPFRALVTQMHEDHIKSHTSQITLDDQSDPDFVNRVTDHIQEHVDMWQGLSQNNPGLLIATNQKILPPPPPPPGLMPPGAPPMPQAQNPQPQPRPTQLAPVGKNIGGGEPPAMRKADEIKQPMLPKVAGTGERAFVPGVTNSPMNQ